MVTLCKVKNRHSLQPAGQKFLAVFNQTVKDGILNISQQPFAGCDGALVREVVELPAGIEGKQLLNVFKRIGL